MRFPRQSRATKESGYVLLFLLLTVALLIVAAAAALPAISFEIRRDKEEELIHRGVQYSRAIRTYYKKFGRYPTRIEELQSTNNMRFLRKRYKDPITGQDFKLLHFGEVKLTFSGGMGGAPNLNQPASLNSPSGFGASSSFNNGQAGAAFGQQPGAFVAATKPNPPPDQAAPGATDQGSSDQNQNSGANASGDSSASPQGAQQPGSSSSSSSSSDQLSGRTFGGGPIVGVISTSKKESIREFNHKKKYDQWQFVYDPALDRGGLLNTPNQPPIQGFGNQNQAGQSAQPGGPNSFFGPQTGQGNLPGQMGQGTASPGNPTPQPGGSPDQQ